MNRNEVTEKIISTKVAKGLQWEAMWPRKWASPKNGPRPCAWAR